ncbi:tetratricopeptide repeat protein [Thermodesulfobacteriota bacterium]
MKKFYLLIAGCLIFLTGAAWGQDAVHFYNLGVNSSLTNRKIHYFTKALEMNPGLTAAYEKRGMLYYFQGKYSQMIQDFGRVIEQKPHTPEAHMWVGLGYLKQENFDAAISNLSRAIGMDPHMAGAYSYRAAAYRQKGMPEEAIRDATRAIELGGTEPVVGRAYTHRAKAYRSMGLNDLADKDFKKAVRLDPEYYVYTLFSSTEFLADMAGKSSNPKRIGRMGAALIVALFFVVIFKLTLTPPKKDEDK